MSHCVVTGGAGFIGGHLVDRLVKDGHHVYVIDSYSTGKYLNRSQATKYLAKDINNWNVVDWQGETFDVVFHLAATSRTPPAVKDPETCIWNNVQGTARVLEVAKLRKIPRVVYSSSNVVYAGATAYRASKLAAEMLCEVYTQLYGQSVIALRYSNVYGARFPLGDYAVFAALRDSMREKGYIEISGCGEQTRDFTHVSDIVEANLLAWKSAHTGTIDICTGVNTSLNEIAKKYFDCPTRYVGERQGDILHICQDPRAAKEILGWEAKVALKDGIKDIWTY